MTSALSIIGVLSIVAFLGGVAFGLLLLFIISIHRTRHAPLSKIHGQRAGSLSRRVLIGVRTNDEEDDK